MYMYIDIFFLYSEIGQFTYLLKLTEMTPLSGSIFGGTTVTLRGNGFGTDSDMVKVKMGNRSCEVNTVTDEQIECVTTDARRQHTIDNQGRHEGKAENQYV